MLLEYVNTNAYVDRHTFTSPESAGWLGYTALEMQYLGPRAQGQECASVFSKLPLAKGAKDSIRTPILCPSASPSLPGQSSREGLSKHTQVDSRAKAITFLAIILRYRSGTAKDPHGQAPLSQVKIPLKAAVSRQHGAKSDFP